mmetsp:Transcript_39874/g.120412  ORF Transcript_39874/g.120412 Transcript_39874/m.120412 type:complete len:578 (-) Transcript_39874:13-1746(-)
MLGAELRLRDARAHDARGGRAARDDVPHLVDDLGAAPLLVRQRLHAGLPLLALDQLDVRGGAARLVLPGEEVDAQGVAMETRQRDELPAEPQLGEVPDEALHLRIRHARRVPIEGGAQVVREHLVRHRGAHLRGELRRLAEDRLARLHPDAVRVRREGDRALDAVVGGALDAEVPLDGPGAVPVEEDVARAEPGGGLPHLRQGHLQAIDEPLRRVLAFGLQRLGDGVGVGHAAGALLPVLVRALLDGLVKRLHALLRRPLDVRVVDGVDVRIDHRRGLRVRTGHDDQRRVQHVGLQADGDKPLGVLPRGHQDLAAHVPALLRARLLVLDVDARRAVLDEHLRQLHRRRQAAVARVGIGDDRVQIIHARRLGALVGGHAAALLVLLAVVEQLRPEELVHLVRHRVVRVVRHVRARLVRRGGRGAALPPRNVNRGEVLGHLHHLHRVQRAEGVGAGALRLVLAHHLVELLGDLRPREVQGHRALELHHILHLVGPRGVLEALAGHPRRHLLHPRGPVSVLGSARAPHLHAAADPGVPRQDMALQSHRTVSHGRQGGKGGPDATASIWQGGRASTDQVGP